jgi:hypothetical protein
VSDGSAVYQDVIAAAVNLAELLNTVEDDDERDRLREEHERRVNDELYRGSQEREALRIDAEREGVTQLDEARRIKRGDRVRLGDGREGHLVTFFTKREWVARGRRDAHAVAVVAVDGQPNRIEVDPSHLSLIEGGKV